MIASPNLSDSTLRDVTTLPFLRLRQIFCAFFLFTVMTGAAVAAANIVVEQPAATGIADGGSKDFGSVLVGSSTSLTFTIKNTGDADLTGLGITKDAGASAGDFTITGSPTTPVTAGGSTTFTVQFAPSATGNRTATIHISNNDPGTNKNPFDITLTGTGTAPVMVVEQPAGTNIANGGSKDFGSVLLGQTQSLTFTIKNTATGPTAAALTGLAITKSGTDAAFFTITSSPTAPVAAGSSTTFIVSFAPTTTPRVFTANLSIANNDPDDDPFVIDLTGTGVAPDLSVEAPVGTPVGATAAEFGSVTSGVPLSKTFTLTNTGTATLTLGTVTSSSGNFLVKSQPASSVAAGASTTLTVQFTPSSAGDFTGALSIPTNISHIPSKNPYAVNLHGTGILASGLSDDFGYTKAVTAPAVSGSFLKDTDADVFAPAGLLTDDQSLLADLGFTFYFYDQAYTRCYIGTNGIITFSSGTSDWTPDSIPSANTPNNFIAPFWTDLDMRSSGKVLYATRGMAPNRTFIVKWQDAPEFGVSGSKVTFQVLLYEGTNTIEYQYQSISGFGTNHNVASGIESPDYGTTQPQPAAGVIGIQHAYGNASGVIGFPSAVRFTRPVVFTVESKYNKPTASDPTLTTVTDTPLLSSSDTSIAPPAGTTYKTPYGTVQRFDAPEFIYMNKDFAKLATAGDVNDPDPSKIAWYRLVNDGYSIDGQVVQGTHTFFTTTLTHDVTVVWRWRLEHAVIIQSDSGDVGFGTPSPALGRNWYPSGTQFTAAIDSVIQNPGAGVRVRTAGYTVYDKTGAIVSPGNDPTTGPLPAQPFLFSGDAVALARRGTFPLSIVQPLRVEWNFVGQVRYRFDALNMDQGGTAMNGQAFVRVYKPAPDRAAPDSVDYPPNGIVYSNGASTEVWIDSGATVGRKVDIGVFYRTTDSAFTLSGFSTPPAGDLLTVSSVDSLNDDSTVPDQLGQFRVARVFSVDHAKAPTEVHWTYTSTIYRAEVPLGLSLDALDRNNQLSPPLPSGKFLKVADTGPGNLITTKVFPPSGSTAMGDPLRWDGLGKALFPVRPGVYEVAWPDDTDPSKSYRVEILTGYPGDTVTRTLGTLNADGSRALNGVVSLTNCATTDGSGVVTTSSTAGLQVGMNVRGPNIPTGATVTAIAPGVSFSINAAARGTSVGLALTAWTTYQNTVVLPQIDPKAGFPGQATGAHYNHLFDATPTRQAPTKLDLSAIDEWKFQDVTYSDPGTGGAAAKSAAGVPFTVSRAGRTVLLYSYRPNADEIADGNIAEENLAVRVVRSSPVNVISRDDSKLVLGRHGLQLGAGSPAAGGAFGLVGSSGALALGNQFVIDFWLNAKGLQPSSTLTVTNCATNGTATVTSASTAGLVAGMSVSGQYIPAGAKVASVASNGTSFTLNMAATGTGSGLSLTAGYSAITLTNCVTDGSTTVTCASTADVVAGMAISGQTIVPGTKIASVVDATTFTLTAAATGNASGAEFTASEKPMTVLASGSGGLKVTLDPASSVVTATYRGLIATHPLIKAGAGWRHYVLHVFKQEVFGTGVTVLDFYLDGIRSEQALPTAALQGDADSSVTAALTSASFRLGVDADPASGLQLDQFRLFTFADFPSDDEGYLTAGEILDLKKKQDMTVSPTTVASIGGSTTFVLSAPATASGAAVTLTVAGVAIPGCTTVAGSTTVTCPSTAGVTAGGIVTGQNVVAGTLLRGQAPRLWYSFEAAPVAGAFVNRGTLSNTGVGPIPGVAPYSAVWAAVNIQEAATRIDCTLDNAGFGGSGFVRNEVSNYNAELYTRSAEVGSWGPIFPVNHSQLYVDPLRKLEVVYYENPYLVDRVPHPNVAWPYIATEYNEVTFPAVGPNKDKAIYIASRIGSEGVDQNGRPQQVYDLAKYSGLKVYQQPNNSLPGYNPNEEHALTAPSGRAALKVKNKGEALANNPPLAAFALQKDINNKPAGTYTSDPWVLVQVNNLDSGEPEMAAYRVFATRTGTIPFPRPADAQVGGSTGLAYEAAATPEARFLTLASGATFNFEYKFDYPVFAGDLVIPPYPLNLVIGNVSMADERGGNIQVNGVNQRTLWRDVSKHAWVVSGGGKFFQQYFYPLRADFYLPGAGVGTSVAWLPPETGAGFKGDNQPGSPKLDDEPRPVKVVYSSAWRSDYPKLKRGETLTYQGGEYFNENPGSQGLPALVAMQAAEVVYDSATPGMVISTATTAELNQASARIIRPLDRREVPFTTAQMNTAGLTPGDPATSKVIVVAERWYFKDLTGSLQKRFYFDSLAETLVFRGRLNDKESGDPNLTQGPDPINVLEPDVLTLDDYHKTAPAKGVFDLATTSDWTTAINAIFAKAQNPNGATAPATSTVDPVFLQGVKPVPSSSAITPDERALLDEQKTFWTADLSGTVTSPDPAMLQLDSFGAGAALVPNANLLTTAPTGSLYVTIAENNRRELNGAPVSLHIVEIVPDRFRGAIQVIEGSDAFSEKITLQHNGEFGANTGSLNYEWWIRDARELDDTLKTEIDSLSTALPSPNWQLYKSGQGLHTIVFEGRPDVVLADKLVLVRYRHVNEVSGGWTQVPFELPSGQTAASAWKPGNIAPLSGAPFQWAGAANSPQLQADGSKRYIPQLVMGWVKRVLDRINPYEARYTDFFSNESPASYTSMIQAAGGPYAGDVALNPSKNVVENTGLIELYQTVLHRARSLSIDNSSNGNSTDGINQALLLAATRLSVLYDLLAREAYSDAQDSTIAVPDDSGLANVASFTFAFQNLEPDLLHEELSLLRGTDFRKSYPVYNRMFWNYAKGLGEAAYNVNYNIYDVNKDGFINESDARLLFPQGHGDAWGHYLSALEMHYVLLQHPNFSWKARAELYSLLQNVLPVDYLDEKTFAKIAAGRARAGRDIVRATYRLKYTQDPDGQWQGYTDSADPARAWGVSEWAHRAGQAAYFDWAVANAILPEQALDPVTGKPLQNLSQIERSAAEAEIGEIAGGLHEIQGAMDEANGGVNPLGFDADAITFDIDPFYDGVVWERKPFFEQIYDRAVTEGKNAVAVLQFATQANNKLRAVADDTQEMIVDSLRQDLDYRNRLIEIFGTPYTGQIGFGKAYPEGYQGPDTMLYAYLDKTTIDQIVPANSSSASNVVTFTTINNTGTGMMNDSTLISIYNKAASGGNITNDFKTWVGNSLYGPETASGPFTAPYKTASKYGFQAPADWGQRTSYGKVQTALGEMLSSEIELDSAIADYIGFLQDYEQKLRNLQSELDLFAKKDGKDSAIVGTRASINTAKVIADGVITTLEIVDALTDDVGKAAADAVPDTVGFSNSLGAPLKAAALASLAAARSPIAIAKQVVEIGKEVADLISEEVIASLERDKGYLDEVGTIQGLVAELEYHSGGDQPKRDAIGLAAQAMELKRQEYFTALSEGFRLLREREAFNKVLAAKTQKNRYQDMIFRLARNEAMSKYQSAFNNAARYTWLAAKAYDYETSLEPGDPAAPTALFNKIVKERQLGLWADDPQSGQGGLAEILAQMNSNFQVLKGQLGINNPQQESEKISLRSELFRVGPTLDPEIKAVLDIPVGSRTADQDALIADNQETINQAAASDARFKDVLTSRIVPDLTVLPEFNRYCRPFSSPSDGPQPGIVVRFSTEINNGVNVFARALVAGDHKYSTANFATKLRGFAVYVVNYNPALIVSPRAYLVPIGDDYLRTSSSALPATRVWSVKEQRIPTPYVINQSDIAALGFIPTMNGLDGNFGDLRRHGDFRVYHDNGDPEADDSDVIYTTRLSGRSVWNSEWMLIIPGANLSADPMDGVADFAETVSDIKLYFDTYSPQGR